MEGSVSNVQFTVSRRGYDPEEVANYLAQIDEKIAGLRTMAAEALERAERAEEQARHTTPDAGLSEDEVASRAAGVLAMAQRTADAALATAREDANRIRLSAEAQAEQLRADTQHELEARRSEHVAALRRETDELVAVRDRISEDIMSLQQQLDEERARVIGIVDALSSVANDEGGLGRAATTPAVATPVVAVVPDLPDAVDEPLDEPVEIAVAVEEIELEDPAGGDEGADVLGFPAPVSRTEPVWAEDPDATSPLTNLFGDDVVVGGPPVDRDDPPFGAEEPLFADADGPVPVNDPSDPSGSADGSFDEEDDDPAMRAFFDADDDEDGSRGSRWGFRRR